MVDQQNRVPVPYQVVHDTVQSDNICGMQTDGRFIQNVQNPRCPVAHCAGQLHALPLTCGQGGRRSVQCEIAKTEIHQSRCHLQIRLADVLCHRPHFFRQGSRHVFHPPDGIFQGHLTCLVEGYAHKPRRSCRFRQSCAMTLRADILLEELFYPLHTFFVFDLIQSI